MCGITGFVSHSAPDREALKAMADRIRHRGPDDEGYYVDDTCAIAHRRLSIIDLAHGHQPMTSPDGNFVLAYNGEVYNFQELREELIAGAAPSPPTRTPRSSSRATPRRARLHQKAAGDVRLRGVGPAKRELYAARDPFGIKPLYYAPMGDTFFFGSELKSFLPHPAFRKELNPEALKFYLTFQYSALDESFLKGVFRLLPGHQLTYREGRAEISAYHTFSFQPEDKPLDHWAQRSGRWSPSR